MLLTSCDVCKLKGKGAADGPTGDPMLGAGLTAIETLVKINL